MTSLFFNQDEKALASAAEVRQLLAEPDKQWVPCYSAYETTCSWFDANGLPETISAIITSDPAFSGAKLKKAYFEKQTALDETGRRPSQTDVLAIVEADSGIAVLGIEGKVNESFGPLISDWNDYSPGKLRRLAGLIEHLKIKPTKFLGGLRYQLFHRTVATLLEARRANAREAAMIVQSFSPNEIRRGFEDFQKFASVLGVPVAEPGHLSDPITLGKVRIRLGWTINSTRAAARR
jgi:hypothetical protein